MDEKQLQILAEEIALPAYDRLDEQQIADMLNAVDKLSLIPFMTGVDFANLLDYREYEELDSDKKLTITSMWALQTIPLTGGFFLNFLQGTFPGGSQTLTNLSEKFVKNVSRAEELGLPKVGAHHVKEVRSRGDKEIELEAVIVAK